MYRWHTGYPGGLKQRRAKDMLERKPENILKKAILGMLNRTNLRHKYIEPRLKIYTGPEHPHEAQISSTLAPLAKHPRNLRGNYNYGIPQTKTV